MEKHTEPEVVVDFHTYDKSLATNIKALFQEQEILESNAFSGAEIITVITTSVLALDKILNFYIQNRKSLKETSVKIGKDEIQLSGFSDKELQNMIESGSLAKLKQQMHQDGQ